MNSADMLFSPTLLVSKQSSMMLDNLIHRKSPVQSHLLSYKTYDISDFAKCKRM